MRAGRITRFKRGAQVRRSRSRMAVAMVMALLGTAMVGAAVASPASAAVTSTWLDVATGNHTCGVKTNRTLWCWGKNFQGQLGNGTKVDSAVPVQVGKATKWASVSVAGYSTCALKLDGSRFCWGANQSGQLGLGDRNGRAVPRRLKNEPAWLQVSMGDGSACGVRRDHTMWCWGELPALGTVSTTPVQVDGGTNWASVSARSIFDSHWACGLRTDGNRLCWGDNEYGQLGVDSFADQPAPTELIAESPTWKTVQADYNGTCGVQGPAGATAIRCWGHLAGATPAAGKANWYVTAAPAQPSLLPVTVTSSYGDWVDVQPTMYGFYGLRANGDLHRWRDAAGGFTRDATPAVTPIARGVIAVDATSDGSDQDFGCYLNTVRRLYCWNARTPTPTLVTG